MKVIIDKITENKLTFREMNRLVIKLYESGIDDMINEDGLPVVI